MVTYSQDSISVRTPNLSPNFKSIVLNPNFTHDNWETKPVDIKYEFAAYTVSFDSEDSTLDGADKIAWGIPEWVAFEIKKGTSKTGCSRPSPWLTDITLNEDKVAPNDGTYKVSGTNDLKMMP